MTHSHRSFMSFDPLDTHSMSSKGDAESLRQLSGLQQGTNLQAEQGEGQRTERKSLLSRFSFRWTSQECGMVVDLRVRLSSRRRPPGSRTRCSRLSVGSSGRMGFLRGTG